MSVHPEVLIRLRYGTGADVEGFNTCRRQHKTIRNKAWMERSAGVPRPWHAGRDGSGNPGGPFGSPYDIPLLRHGRGNPDTELSGSLYMMGEAGKYRNRECLPYVSGESYHA